MNIVLDGLSGVGKTYYGTKFAQEHDITFLPFLPSLNDLPREELIHHELIMRQSIDTYPVLFEGNVIASEVVKLWMYKKGLISLEELWKVLSADISSIKDYAIIYLIDDYENIKNKRAKRNRPFEYHPKIDKRLLSDLDKFITQNIRQVAKRHNIKFEYIDIRNKTDRQVLDEIEATIVKLLI